jgi:putative chitinase
VKLEELKQICPSVKNAEMFVPILNEYFIQYEFNTVNRQAMFIAQTLHETGGYKFLREIWGPTIWQVKYENHRGLGNIHPGDGKKFLGRGLIQCTGRANYQSFADWIKDQDIMSHPEILETPSFAVLSAIWFWQKNNLMKYADDDNIEKCTRIINGSGMLGLEERKRYYELGKKVLSI